VLPVGASAREIEVDAAGTEANGLLVSVASPLRRACELKGDL
jgi:hypothetical protein